jgi:hypothetical protein
MNVVFLDFARTRKRSARSNSWTPDETEQLTRLFHTTRDHVGAAGFAYGKTDHHDPQFYIVNSSDAQPCTACVSRLNRDGHRWYVIEDGQGLIQKEGSCLRTLVENICGSWHSARDTLAAAFTFIGQQWVTDATFSPDLAVVFDCLSAIA